MDPNPPISLNGSLSRGEGWYPVIKKGGLGFSYQERRVGIHLSSGDGWDQLIKRGRLGSINQEGRVGIHLSRGKGWDPFIKRSHLVKWIPALPS
jgi:hypothetical protein